MAALMDGCGSQRKQLSIKEKQELEVKVCVLVLPGPLVFLFFADVLYSCVRICSTACPTNEAALPQLRVAYPRRAGRTKIAPHERHKTAPAEVSYTP